jgi:hypothetical protein
LEEAKSHRIPSNLKCTQQKEIYFTSDFHRYRSFQFILLLIFFFGEGEPVKRLEHEAHFGHSAAHSPTRLCKPLYFSEAIPSPETPSITLMDVRPTP